MLWNLSLQLKIWYLALCIQIICFEFSGPKDKDGTVLVLLLFRNFKCILVSKWNIFTCSIDIPKYLLFSGAKVLHYAQTLFEGMKAYRGDDEHIRLFRPMHNMTRMVITAKRACFPVFEEKELLQCIQKLIQIDREWVPHSTTSSLYIRYLT